MDIIIKRVYGKEFRKIKKQLLPLIRSASESSFISCNITDEYCKERLDKAEFYLDNGNAVIFVAMHEDKVLGWAWTHLIERFKEVRLHVASVAISTEYQHQGIGKKIIKYIEEYAKDNDILVVELFVTVKNENAVGFYNSLGFDPERYLLTKKMCKQREENLYEDYINDGYWWFNT